MATLHTDIPLPQPKSARYQFARLAPGTCILVELNADDDANKVLDRLRSALSNWRRRNKAEGTFATRLQRDDAGRPTHAGVWRLA